MKAIPLTKLKKIIESANFSSLYNFTIYEKKVGLETSTDQYRLTIFNDYGHQFLYVQGKSKAEVRRMAISAIEARLND